MVRFWREGLGLSERRACCLIGLDRSTHRYQRRADRNGELRQRLRELAEQRRRFGYRRLHVLLRREGHAVNKKRVQRLYRQEGLSLRGRRRKKRYAGLRVVLPVPNAANQRWSMDFMTDALPLQPSRLKQNLPHTMNCTHPAAELCHEDSDS